MNRSNRNEFQYIPRIYRVVSVDDDGVRTILSCHASYSQAHNSAQLIIARDDQEVRIETLIDMEFLGIAK